MKQLLILVLLLASFAAAQNETRTITDDAGNEVEIPVNPERVAVAGERILTEMTAAFGVEPTAAAAIDEFAPFLVEALGGTDDIMSLGSASEVNLEALAAANPDLILLDVREEGDLVLEAARQLAPTVQIESYAVSPYRLIDMFSAVFSEETGAELKAQLDGRIEDIRASVADPESIEVSVAQLEPSGFRIILDGFLGVRLLEEIGFARPEGQDEAAQEETDREDIRNLSLEELPRIEGDILFFQTYDDQEDLDSVVTSPLWETLDVVQRDAVQFADYRYWNLGGVLAAELVLDNIVAGLEQAGLTENSAQ